MKKIINTAERFVPEMLEGIYAAHPNELAYVNGDLHCLVNARTYEGKVGLATGGGSGHLPLFLGFVGEGMLDGCAISIPCQAPGELPAGLMIWQGTDRDDTVLNIALQAEAVLR